MVVNSMIYATYERYKDSGVDWLGAIPSDWELGRISAFFSERRQKVSDKDYPALSVTKLGVFPQWENVAKSNDGDNRKLVKKGDFVINSRSDRKGSSGIAKQDGSVSLINIVLKPVNIEPRYSEYLFKSYNFIEEFYRVGHGIVADLWTTRFDDIKNSMIALPTFDEQVKIANFLDQKTAQIDQAIALKQQQIEKLGEYKQIVIQNAVTKGLNPNATMKNSGVDWIGDIPEHWEVIRFRNAFRFNKGLNITKENLNDEQGILCLNYGEIHSKYGFEFIPNVHPLKFVDESYLKNNQKSLLNDGDFVFADTSEDIEGSGNFSYINGQDLVFAGYHTLIAKPKINFNSRFIAYVLDSSAFRNQVRVRVKGVKVFSITQAILKTTFIWLPTEQEQNEIVKYLDEKMQKFNNAKIAYQTQIDRLKEYKNILINQAVTGKIKI